MKTRFGFVSNSSSSSFCIIGKRIDKDNIDFLKNIYATIYDDNSGGRIFFKFQPQMQDLLTEPDYRDLTFYEVCTTGEYGTKLDISKLTDGCCIYAIERSHSSIDTLEEFKEMFNIN